MSEVEYGIYEPPLRGLLKTAVGPVVGTVGLAVCALVGFVAAASIANMRAGASATPDDAARIAVGLIDSRAFLIAVAAPALLFVAAGGYLSARAAQSEAAGRALPVGLASAVAAAFVVFVAPVRVPLWLAGALAVAPLPAALCGVGLRYLAARRTARHEREAARRGERRAETNFPRPPARAPEEDRALAAQVAGALERQEAALRPQPPAHARPAPAAPGKLEALDGLRAAVRAALLTHPAATEEDFERCWPAIRDEIFKQHTLRVYNSRGARDDGKR